MSINFSDLLSTVSGAAKLIGKGNGGDTLARVAQVWGEFKKYPQNMEGIQKALADYGVTEEQAATAMRNINPQLKTLIEDKVPGSMDVVLSAIKNKGAAAPSGAAPIAPPVHSENVQRLLAASARK